MMNTNNTEKELTGYPSIDKPWMKYFSKDAALAELPKGSMYDYLCYCNKDRTNSIAINYFGQKITHNNLKNEIEKCAKALIASGVKSGDYISLCLLTIPEAVYLIYAINKIGAVCNFLVLSASINDLHKQISVSKSKIVITMDMVTEKIVTAAKNTDVSKIISVSVSDSMPVYLSIPLKFKKKCFDIPKTVISWNNFIANAKNTEIPDIITDGNAPAIIEYTGGTTGTPKGVVLSNRASNAFVFNHQLANAIFVIKAGERYLDILPPFYAYGLFSGIHFPLCAGVETILSPDPSPEIFPELVMRYHAHHFACGPLHIDNLAKEAEQNNLDLSFIKTIAFGGDKVSEEWEKRMTDILEAHGATNVLCNGYGMTETAGAFCLITHKVKKMIPFVKNSVKVIDIDTGVELKYGQEGEICVSGPQLMTEYYRHKQETKDVIWEENGIRWMHTGDLGYISEDGAISISGRIKRILYSVGDDQVPYRVYPMQIESVISRHHAVQKCSVVGRPDTNKGYVPIAFIVLRDNSDPSAALMEIKQLCIDNLPQPSLPVEYRIVDSLPLTTVGKVDYRALEGIVNNEVT